MLLANEVLPASIPSFAGFLFPLVGASSPSSIQATQIPVPDACNTLTFQATVFNAPGTSAAIFYLTIGQVINGVERLGTIAGCTVTANNKQVVSCSSTFALASYNPNSFGAYVIADGGFSGANVLTTATCQ